MFFNAMRRKGWTPDEADMPAVVAIHNAVNERAWAEVVAWEARAGGARACGGPRLVRFEGRPRDVSPKARLLNVLGYRLPFDRHDWYVQRCGKTVRYVIDFYNAAPGAASPPPPSSSSSPLPPPVALHLDVRPALDSPGAAWERVKAQAAWVVSGRWRE
jgi:cytochrome c heme-lyase